MGENKHIKELDAFAKKYLKEIPEEQPSVNFTASLLKSIQAENVLHEEKKVQPLISKKVWAFIAVVVLAVLCIPFQKSEESMFNLPDFNVNFLDNFQLPSLFEIPTLSNTVLYAILFFGFMLFVQFVFLKNHFNKRFH